MKGDCFLLLFKRSPLKKVIERKRPSCPFALFRPFANSSGHPELLRQNQSINPPTRKPLMSFLPNTAHWATTEPGTETAENIAPARPDGRFQIFLASSVPYVLRDNRADRDYPFVSAHAAAHGIKMHTEANVPFLGSDIEADAYGITGTPIKTVS